MIRLYQYEPAFGLPNASPFCMKLETYLRMAQLPFVAPQITWREIGRAPKGKLPYVCDGDTVLADSTLVIDYLKATYGDPLDAWLSAEQRAVALAFQRLLEENLYWALLHSRWIEPQGWAMTQAAFFGALPVPLRWIIPPLARRGMRHQLRGHGMGRHTTQEIHAIGQRDITALADIWATRPTLWATNPARSTPAPTPFWPIWSGCRWNPPSNNTPRATPSWKSIAGACAATTTPTARWCRTQLGAILIAFANSHKNVFSNPYQGKSHEKNAFHFGGPHHGRGSTGIGGCGTRGSQGRLRLCAGHGAD